MKREFQGNLLGHFYELCERLPDAFWTHVVAFIGGMIFALILGLFVTFA